MPRVAVLADIHGNGPALDAVLADMADAAVDHVLVPGDVVNRGPYTREVLEIVFAQTWSVIRGNHELYLLHAGTPYGNPAWPPFSNVMRLRASLPRRWIDVIAGLPDSLLYRPPDAPPIAMFHASPGDHWRGLMPNPDDTSDEELAATFANVGAETILTAHTHLHFERRVGGLHVLNPGAVGSPLDGVPGARYLLLDSDGDGWHATFRHVHYDLTPLLDRFTESGFVAENGVVGWLLVEEFNTLRPCITTFYRWLGKHHGDITPTLDHCADWAAASDRWNTLPSPYRLNL